ncbi:MAG TPA: NAD(P)-binding protein [Saprospiraceae bacterium]|nr:NAD(P)-binding protein [Saprospiraceae bacterium]HPG08829.1 NAD(P)-binding protein [Saprospiraceae bacterium]HQU52803.1 NAD(P)-binding protein [Saprospiraceae bacterium]HRV83737.1 NAD(P)-binding protein [Saprospiraceae bacterium]
MIPLKDLTTPIDLGDHAKGTGQRRTQRPVYTDYLPPCNQACPAGENIQAWLALAQDGLYEEAWQELVTNNPLPAIHGRVCYHPCEDGCNRKQMDTSVSIHSVERFLGDLAIEKNWQVKYAPLPGGKKVLVIGAGPSGLSAAYHLARLGHQVEIFEAGPLAGGMMHFGIPAYRLPRNIISAEIQRIENMGVKIHLNRKVEDVVQAKQEGNFDAVFVAVGAHIGKKTNIPARDAGQILDAVSFLKDVELGNTPKLGRRVAIYGGGNTAMDAARIAKRIGVDEAMIIYRRDREHMPAHDFEADEALSEGVKIHWLRTIKDINQSTFTVEVMRVENGRPVPTGEYETLEADALILALGQDTDTDFLRLVPGIDFKDDGTVIVGPDMMTGAEGIFAGGDMVPSERTVTIAVGHGKKAARFMDGYLRRKPYVPAPKHPVVGFEKLHVWYQTFAPAQEQPHLEPDQAIASFDEVVTGLTPEEARYEAQRCLSCGNCFECDGCYGACPEDAIIKLGPGKRYRYNYDLCTGCAVCFEQCPCHAIEMVPEPDSSTL